MKLVRDNYLASFYFYTASPAEFPKIELLNSDIPSRPSRSFRVDLANKLLRCWQGIFRSSFCRPSTAQIWPPPLTPLIGILNHNNIFRVLGLCHELCSLLSTCQDTKLLCLVRKLSRYEGKWNHQYNSRIWNGHEMSRKLLKFTFLEQRYSVFTTDLHTMQLAKSFIKYVDAANRSTYLDRAYPMGARLQPNTPPALQLYWSALYLIGAIYTCSTIFRWHGWYLK